MVTTRSSTAATAQWLPDTSANVPATVSSASSTRKRARDDEGNGETTASELRRSGGGVQKRARAAGTELSTARTTTACTTRVGGASTLTDERTAEILRDASARLVWSRVDEVEGLKLSLDELGRIIDELGRATSRAEAIRRRVEACVDRDLASARKVAAVRLPGVERVRFEEPFSKFFYTLIRHLLPNN